jgi:PPK2 family polyphosphate:nucleotide phosphotransferase
MSLDLDRFRIRPGHRLKLDEHDPRETGDLDKKEGEELLESTRAELRELQERLWAEDRWSLLVVFQAQDAAGKDSLVDHVFTGLNPQGCEVHSFKVPSAEELDHDFLWRAHLRVPPRGRVGIFNRSHYEEVLVVRVHPEFLTGQKLPASVVGSEIWKERYEDIAAFERYLVRNGVAVRKFFLNVSRAEQKKRFLERLTRPEKRWKFALGDVKERKLWDRYREAYEDAISATTTKQAPWYVVPADKKWFTRLVVMRLLVQALRELDPQWPKPDPEQEDELEAARKQLEGEKD